MKCPRKIPDSGQIIRRREVRAFLDSSIAQSVPVEALHGRRQFLFRFRSLTSRTSKWKEVIMLESFPRLLFPALRVSLSSRTSPLHLFSRENSNLRLEQTLRTLAEKRSSNEWQCAALLLPRFSSHLHFTFLFLCRLENQRFAIPISSPLSRMHSRGFCLRVFSTSLFLPLFVSETFSSARYAKVSLVLARRPIAITGRAE